MRLHHLVSLGLLIFIASMVWRVRNLAGPPNLHERGSAMEPLGHTDGSAAHANCQCPPPGEQPSAECPPPKECPPTAECPPSKECPPTVECPLPKECPQSADGGCDTRGKYNLKHLTQAMDQNVVGPIQDDEALLLYSIVRGMRMEAVIEIGGLSGYSATNFIQAMEPFNGTMYTIDVGKVPVVHPTRHKFVQKNVYNITADDLDRRYFDMIFFDAHVLNAQFHLYKVLEENKMIDDDTLIALHDTHLHPKPDWEKDPPQVPKLEEGTAHQPVERAMVNKLKTMGWDSFSLHTPFKRMGRNFPKRHGLTIMQRFKLLPGPTDDAVMNPVVGTGR